MFLTKDFAWILLPTSPASHWLWFPCHPWPLRQPVLWGIDFSELSRLLRLFCVNSHPCKTAGNTSGLLKWGTMINHSCLPNVAGTAAFFLIGGWFIHIYTRHPVVKTCGMNLGVILCGWWADVSHVLPTSRGAGAQASTEIPMAFWWSGMNVWEHIWYYNISYHK